MTVFTGARLGGKRLPGVSEACCRNPVALRNPGLQPISLTGAWLLPAITQVFSSADRYSLRGQHMDRLPLLQISESPSTDRQTL